MRNLNAEGLDAVRRMDGVAALELSPLVAPRASANIQNEAVGMSLSTDRVGAGEPGMTLDVSAPLLVRLQTIQARIEREHPMLTAPIEAFLARLQAARAGNAAPQVGEILPDVVLPDLEGRFQRLHVLAAQGPLVVSFLRGHWCPYCRTFAGALAAATPLPRGARLVFITPERAAFAKALAAGSGAPGPVLIDVDNGYALTLGLAVWMDPVYAERMAAADADVAASQGSNLSTVPIPATFVIDRRGVVRARHVEPNYRERMALEDIIAVLKALD